MILGKRKKDFVHESPNGLKITLKQSSMNKNENLKQNKNEDLNVVIEKLKKRSQRKSKKSSLSKSPDKRLESS